MRENTALRFCSLNTTGRTEPQSPGKNAGASAEFPTGRHSFETLARSFGYHGQIDQRRRVVAGNIEPRYQVEGANKGSK